MENSKIDAPAGPENILSETDQKDIEKFVENSQNYCERVYGGKTFEEADIDELRKEFRENNEAVKKIKLDWGVH
jgi:hypothetical protein